MAPIASHSEAASALSPEAIQAWRTRIRETTFSNYHHCMGVALEREGNLEAAIAAYRRALGHQPDLPETGYRLVDAVRRSGDSAEADRLHRGLLQINAFYVGDALAHFSVQSAADDTSTAIGWLNEAVALGVSQPSLLGTAYEAIGTELYRKRQIDEAFPYLSRAIEIDPSSMQSQLHLGDIHLTRCENSIARHYYLTCVEHTPSWSEPYFPLAWTYLVDRKFKLALEFFGKASELGFRYPASLALGRGWAHHAQENFSEAIAAYDSLKGHNPDMFLLASYKALALHVLGQLDEAISIHRAVSQAHPTNTDVHLNMALALCDVGEIEAAQAAHQLAAAIEPERAWTILTSAWILVHLGQTDEAREECRKLLKIQTNMIPLGVRLLPNGMAKLGAILNSIGIEWA